MLRVHIYAPVHCLCNSSIVPGFLECSFVGIMGVGGSVISLGAVKGGDSGTVNEGLGAECAITLPIFKYYKIATV